MFMQANANKKDFLPSITDGGAFPGGVAKTKSSLNWKFCWTHFRGAGKADGGRMEKRMQHGYFIRVFSAIKWENLKREQSTRECEREGYFLRQVGRKILINSIIKRSHTHTPGGWKWGGEKSNRKRADKKLFRILVQLFPSPASCSHAEFLRSMETLPVDKVNPSVRR